MLPRTQILSATDTSIGISQDISTRSLASVTVGNSAGSVSTGTNNAFIGVQAGAQNTTGSYVTAIGFQAAAQNTNSSYATMIGAYAGAQNLSGDEVLFAGYRAGELNKSGGQHVGIGAYALRENYSGNASVAVGYRAGERTLDGGFNTMIGAYSGQDNRSGNFNTMGGYSAGRSAFLGDENTYFGAFAGYSNSKGSANTLAGYRSGASLTTGDFNVAIGAYSMEFASFAYSNVVIGPFAGRNQTAKSVNNVILGTNVATNANVADSVIIGAAAGQNLAGSGLVVIGTNSGSRSFHGSSNILIGNGANLFSDSNNFAISIGSVNTVTFTNSTSIGNSIKNERENSVILGNNLTSDAPQSVVVGNNISLQSVIFFKDSLYDSYSAIALADGVKLFGICNIQYTDTLKVTTITTNTGTTPPTTIPVNTIYQTATAKIVTSNVVNSGTNPEQRRLGPSTYDLLQTAVNNGYSYATANGQFYPIRSLSDSSNLLSAAFPPPLTTNVSASLYTLCNIPAPLPSSQPPYPPSYHLSNYYYNHEYTPYYSFSNSVAAVTNVSQLNSSNLAIPIAIVKKVAPPEIRFAGYNLTVPSSLYMASAQSIPVPTTLTNWAYTVNSNLGIRLPRCNVLFTVTTPPKYGELNNTIFTQNNIQTLAYTPHSEFGQNTADTFAITPIFSITDANSCNYGVPCPTSANFNITFAPSTCEIYAANQITMRQYTAKTLALSDILSSSIPALNPATTLINVYQLDSAFVLSSNHIIFTAADCQKMAAENIGAYPPSQRPIMYMAARNAISAAVACNVQYATTTILPALCNISTASHTLSNTISYLTDASRCLSNIYLSSTALINLVPATNDVTTNTYRLLNTLINTWYIQYDPQYVYPATTTLINSIASFQSSYYGNNLFNAWSNLNIMNPLFSKYSDIPVNSNESAALLNIAAYAATTSFSDSTYRNSQLRTVQYTDTIYPTYSTAYRKYVQTSNLFISFSDLANSAISLIQIATPVSTAKPPAPATTPTITFNITTAGATTGATLPIPISITSSNNTVWQGIQIPETTATIIANSNLNLYSATLPNLKLGDYFIQTPPTAGILSVAAAPPTNGSTNGANLSNVTYILTNPWATADAIDVTVRNNSAASAAAQSVTTHHTFAIDNSIRTLPITFGAAKPTFNYPIQSNIYDVYQILTIQCNIDTATVSISNLPITQSTIYTPVFPYSPLTGYVISTSNVSLSNTLNISTVLAGTGSNTTSNYYYTSYSFSNTSNSFRYNTVNLASNIFGPVFSTSNSSLQSNIVSWACNIINAVVYFAQGDDTIILTSNQTHYDHYDYNTGDYIYHSDDAIIYLTQPLTQRKINKPALPVQPGPYIINYLSNQTTHYSYNKYESFLKLNRTFLYNNTAASYNIPAVPSVATSNFLFINSNVGPVASWNPASDNVYIAQQSAAAVACNISLNVATFGGASATLQVRSIPAGLPGVSAAAASVTLALDQTMTSPIQSLFLNDNIGFVPSDINFINVDKGAIVNTSTGTSTSANGGALVTAANYNNLAQYKYLATGRYDSDTIQYFYSSNNVYASSNYAKTIKLSQGHTQLGQTFNIGPSTNNNTLNPNLLYYSVAGIPQSNIGINITNLPANISVAKIGGGGGGANANGTPMLFKLSDTSNIQITAADAASNVNAAITFDVVNITNSYSQSPPVITGLSGMTFAIKTYNHYEFPLSNVDATNLLIDNLGNAGWQNTCIGSLWSKINALKAQGAPISPSLIQLIVTPPNWPANGCIVISSNVQNSIYYSDIAANNLRYLPRNQLSSIAGLSNDRLSFQFVYNQQFSPVYDLNIKNYVSRFTPRIVNASSFSNTAPAPDVSGGLAADNIAWTLAPGCNINFKKNTTETRTIAWSLGAPILSADSEFVATFNSTIPVALNTATPLNLYVDQADSTNFTALIDYVVTKPNNDIYFYVTTPPKYGIIQNLLTGAAVVQFRQSELATTIYQHLGQSLVLNDAITIAVSSSPYDLSQTELAVAINIRAMPVVTNNRSQYVYFDKLNDALNSNVAIPTYNLGISGGYIHVIDTTQANIGVATAIVGATANVSFRLTSAMLKTTTAPYPKLGFDFAYNNHSSAISAGNVGGSVTGGAAAGAAYYINHLAEIPLYTPLFNNHYDGYLNSNIDNNVIVTETANNQVISYSLIQNPALFANNSIYLLFQVQPLTSLINSQMEFIYQNTFSVNLYQGTTALIHIQFTRYSWILKTWGGGASAGGIIYSGTLPSILDSTAFNTILIVNNDAENGGYLSIYWKYVILGTANVNLLEGLNIASPDLTLLDKIEISVPIKDPLNYVSSSNFVRKIDGGDMAASYSLNNYYTTHLLQNMELYVGNVGFASSNTHNVILGKSITVRGTNNICVGNTFSTSGDSSIIIGNNIASGGINGINNSIIISNNSFADSAIYNMISIGNSNLNYLRKSSDIATQNRVNNFLAQYPIIIGNGISIDKIDYNINIGNVFLKTTVGGDQIYLGNQGEKVGIGYSSNVGLQSALCINGDIVANSISVKNFVDTVPTITAYSSVNIPLNYLVSATGVYTADTPITRLSQNNDYAVLGVCMQNTQTANVPLGQVNSYKLYVGISGHMKVWCTGVVTVGDFLSAKVDGIAYSVGHQVITQNTTSTVSQQSYVVKKIINGMPVFASQSQQPTTTSTSSNVSSYELISSYTFGKATMTWDPANPQITPWIATNKLANGTIIGLIGCIVSY